MGFNQPKFFYALTLGFYEYFQTSEGLFVTDAQLKEEQNETCKVIREQMIHLWSTSKKIKCGDEGYTPNKNVVDPLEAPAEDKKDDAKETPKK